MNTKQLLLKHMTSCYISTGSIHKFILADEDVSGLTLREVQRECYNLWMNNEIDSIMVILNDGCDRVYKKKELQ